MIKKSFEWSYVIALVKFIKTEIFFNDTHRVKLCLTQYNTRIQWYRNLAACDPFHMFIQSVKFYIFRYHIWKSTDVWK